MKNSNKGFAVPLLIGIIVLLVIGGGVYIYTNKKVEVPAVVDNATVQSNPTGSTPLVGNMVNKSFDKYVKLADKELLLGFGQNYFLAKEILVPKTNNDKLYGDILYKMIYDTNTVYDMYVAGSNTLYEHGNFQSWLARQIARYNSIVPSGNGVEFEKWYVEFRGTGSARVIGKYVDNQSIKVEKVVTYVQ
ncbi:MAG: hypothetical protein WCG02_03390 [Candidatus Taylorbacteria bacterium]